MSIGFDTYISLTNAELTNVSQPPLCLAMYGMNKDSTLSKGQDAIEWTLGDQVGFEELLSFDTKFQVMRHKVTEELVGICISAPYQQEYSPRPIRTHGGSLARFCDFLPLLHKRKPEPQEKTSQYTCCSSGATNCSRMLIKLGAKDAAASGMAVKQLLVTLPSRQMLV